MLLLPFAVQIDVLVSLAVVGPDHYAVVDRRLGLVRIAPVDEERFAAFGAAAEVGINGGRLAVTVPTPPPRTASAGPPRRP